MQVQYIQECSCGAVTVTFPNGAYNSVSREMFDSMAFEGERLPEVSYCCNHCVNHWGLDLCKCGSGEPFEQCSCGKNLPGEELGIKRPFIGIVLYAC